MRTVTPDVERADAATLATMIEYVELAVARAGSRARLRAHDGSFSMVEHVWHLADLEREGFGVRIERLAQEERPFLADFQGDVIARERAYHALSLEDGLAAFAAARRANLARLASVAAEAWAREGEQEGVGRVCLGDVPAMMAGHDAAHRGEIEALLAELS
jgi:hypothetical protein